MCRPVHIEPFSNNVRLYVLVTERPSGDGFVIGTYYIGNDVTI